MRSPYSKILAAGAAIVAVGCSNPTKDYDDFRDRIGALTDASTIDSGVDAAPEVARDGSVFDEAGVDAFSGTYWSICLDKSYAGDISAAVDDVFHLTFTKGGDGSVSVSGTRQVLKLGANNLSQTVGEVVTIPATPVDANGSFAAHVATFITPKEANIFGFDLTVENGLYSLNASSPSELCGHFTGKVTAPIPQDVDETCVLKRVGTDGAFTQPANADGIHCP
jgi:hypothetical protein